MKDLMYEYVDFGFNISEDGQGVVGIPDDELDAFFLYEYAKSAERSLDQFLEKKQTNKTRFRAFEVERIKNNAFSDAKRMLNGDKPEFEWDFDDIKNHISKIHGFY